MRRKQDNFDEEASIDLTPMLDIVFIMLIFFIVTTSFVKESGIDINRPNNQDQIKSEKNSIVVRINEHNEIRVKDRMVDVRRVRNQIELLLAANPESAVVVQASEKSKIDVMVGVMDAARQAGVANVSLATTQ